MPKLQPALRRIIAGVAGLALGITGLSVVLPSQADADASAYSGATVGDRGTILGSTNYTPPSGAVFVNSASGNDSAAGTSDKPVKTVARAHALVAAGGTIVLRAGTYHEFVEVTKRVTIQNYPGETVWFDGSVPVTSWTKSGTVWTAPWTTFFSSSINSSINYLRPGYPDAGRPALMFVNGEQLKEVGSQSAVVAGTFFADQANKRLVLGTDPTGKQVRSSDLKQAFHIIAPSTNLRGIGIRRYATPVDTRGAVLMDVDGGTFEHLVVVDNASIGMALSGANKTLRNVTVERNGLMGFGSDRGTNLVLTKSVIRENNRERFAEQPVAAGVKITRAVNATISDNTVSNNYLSAGVWLDEYCSNFKIFNNQIADNGGKQIEIEASANGFIANNEISGGVQATSIRSSGNVRFFNNVVGAYNLMGIDLAQDSRWKTSLASPAFPLLVKDIVISNNVFACGTRFQIFGKDAETNIPMDKFNTTITGNLFSPRTTNPERNMVAWGKNDNNSVEFLQTPDALKTKNSTWNNKQSTSCLPAASLGTDIAAAQSIAAPLPSDISGVLGVTSGTKTVGLLKNTPQQPVVPSVTPPPASTAPPAPAPNQSPTAKISASSSDFVATLSGADSSDPDGKIASFAWDFGDGTSGSGAQIQHVYEKGGTYTVKLTVTDDRGAKHTATYSLTITAPPAFDSFSRSAANGWGTATGNGTWVVSGGSAAFSVADGVGKISLAPSHTREALVPTVLAAGTLTETKVSSDQVADGAAGHVTVVGRMVGTNYYGGRVRFEPGGVVRVYALRNETALANSYVLPQSYKAGTRLNVKVSVTGTSPTTVKVRVWVVGTAEPGTWNVVASDSHAALQKPGSPGLNGYVSRASRHAVTVFRIDDYKVTLA